MQYKILYKVDIHVKSIYKIKYCTLTSHVYRLSSLPRLHIDFTCISTLHFSVHSLCTNEAPYEDQVIKAVPPWKKTKKSKKKSPYEDQVMKAVPPLESAAFGAVR